jgi:Cu(I)/Ag(I) efflux system membrane fusion protein
VSRPRRFALGLAVALAAIGLGALGGWFAAHGSAAVAATSGAVTVAEDEYVCPMHPEIVDHHQGACPICGMKLVKAQNAALHHHDRQVDAAALSDLGVSLVAVRRLEIDHELRTYGTVVPDEARLYTVSSKFDGWLRKLYLHSVGERVEQGQVVYEIYSPDVVMKEREYFKFLARRKQILQAVGDVSQQENEYVMDLLRDLQKEREEFLRLDLGVDTIRQLEDSGTTIEVVKVLAQRSGIVTQLNAREGGFVSPAAPVFTLADPSRVWVDVALYAGQIDRVHAGDPVSLAAGDGPSIEAKVDFVNPLAENGRGRARVVIAHPPAELRLGALVDVTIHAQARPALVLPSSAVTRTGHGDVVMLARGEGHFLPVAVECGIEAGDQIEVHGLREGAVVASNAQFLLDSAASLGDTEARKQPKKIPASFQ